MNAEIIQFVTFGLVVIALAEISYLVVKLPRQTSNKNRYMFVDTSVLIDGRIVPIIASGFVSDIVAIPRSVIGELQFLADNADPEKRSRARHGLDIVRELQQLEGVNVLIFQDGSKAEEGVDERLLFLAKKHGGA
ncbi:PIN/TRAM domain-containing protein, partial [Candidatus Saccharibacteria bacterium]|nr:PIN/TRAM domain-containing protein [Candidatus Saccharibacteria bacterium]